MLRAVAISLALPFFNRRSASCAILEGFEMVEQKREDTAMLKHLLHVATALIGGFLVFFYTERDKLQFLQVCCHIYLLIRSRKSLSGLPA